jgi:hypothetical protein
MSSHLNTFRQEFLGANTWLQRKDGVPLDLLDKLSSDELSIAEAELIKAADTRDSWPILGLAHIKSTKALPTLYGLLGKGSPAFTITTAYAIFRINEDPAMINVVLQQLPHITNQYELIDLLYLLPAFKDNQITSLLHSCRNHKEYLVAYNATRALGLPTEEVVKRSRRQMD